MNRFVDIGAHDGVTFSNTYFFEYNLNWEGICIEPNPEVFNLLNNNRKSININCAIASVVKDVDFLCVRGYSDMLSGIAENFNNLHRSRIANEIQKFNQDYKIVKIKTNTLNNILNQYNYTHIELMSIDTEGSEYEVLNSIDFNRVEFDLIIVENNYNENQARNLLKLHNYILAVKIESEEFYCRPQNVNHIQSIAKKFFRKKSILVKFLRSFNLKKLSIK